MEYTCSISLATPSAQCSYTPRTKPPRRNCAAPSTTSRVTTTPSTPTLGETKRQLSVRFKEHCKLDKPTGVRDHCNATGHSVSMANLRVLDREQDWLKHKVKEAIHIKQRAPSMNRDQGYQLPPIYGQIIPRPPPPEPNHPPWSLRDQDLLEADRNVAIVSPSVPKWVKFNHFLCDKKSWSNPVHFHGQQPFMPTCIEITEKIS